MAKMDSGNNSKSSKNNSTRPYSFYEPNDYERQYYPEQDRKTYINEGRTTRSAFLGEVSSGLKDLDEYQKKLTNVTQGYNKMLNDQADILAKISKARTVEEDRAYKSQLVNAQRYSEEQLRLMKRTYAEQRKYLDAQDKRDAKDKIRKAEQNAQEVLKTVKRVDKQMYNELNKGSTATFMGKFSDFANSISKAYTSFNINQLVNSGLQTAQSNASNTNQLQAQNGLTNNEAYTVSSEVKKAVKEQLGSSIKSSEAMQYVGQAGSLVGGNDTKAIAELTKTLATRNEFGLNNDVTNSVDTARSLGLDPNEYLQQLTDQQTTLTKVKTANGGTLKIRQGELAQQLDGFQSGIAANISDPSQLATTNKNLMSMLASYQDQSATTGNAVNTVLQSAINDPSSASKLGISSTALNKAMASGDTDKINEMLFSASNRLSNSGSNSLLLGQALGLDPEGINAFKNIYNNKDTIAQNTQLAQNTPTQDTDETTRESEYHKGGSIFQKTLRPVIDKISSAGEWVSSQMGTDPTEVNSQLTTIINLLIALNGSDLLKTGGSLLSTISGKVLGSAGKHAATSSLSSGALGQIFGGSSSKVASLTSSSLFSALAKAGGFLAIGTSIVDGIQGVFKADKIFGATEGSKLSSKFSSGLGYALAGSGEGGILGALGNGAKGAAIGTMIAPGIGTVLGALIGGVLGSIGPEKIAKALNLESTTTTNEKTSKKKAIYGGGTKEKTTNVLTGVDSSSGGYVSPFSRVLKWFNDDDSKRASETKKNSHKTGLETVPKDDYYATLHKDEAVLTKDQANTWREQQRGESSTNFLKTAIKNAKFTDASKTVAGASSSSNTSSPDSSDADASNVNVAKTGQAFVDELGSSAVTNYKKNKMLPSFFIAQAAHESAGGQSYLARVDNNLGGNKMPNKYASKQGTQPTDGTGGYYAHFDTKADWAKGQIDYYAGSMGNGVRGQTSIEGSVNAIRANGYFTAPPAEYLAAVRSWVKNLNLEDFDKKNGVKATAYEQGTPWVPDTQLALLHKGEMVVPKDQNPTNSNNTNKVTVGGTGLDSSLEQILTWGFNKVVDAIVASNTNDLLSVPNLPKTDKARN